MYITLILFLFILFLTFISITGFGKFFIKLFNLNIHLVSDFKILEFIFGLIFVGFFGIIINFITNINDFITLSTMTFGVFLYFLFFIKTKNKKNEIYLILLLVFVFIKQHSRKGTSFRPLCIYYLETFISYLYILFRHIYILFIFFR